MIRSMTGVGKARRTSGDFDISARLRALNNRYLDVNLRLPPAFLDFEHLLRQRIVNGLGRGKIDVFVDIKDQRPGAVEVSLNRELVEAILAASEFLRERPEVEGGVDIASLLPLPGVLVLEPAEVDDPEGFQAGLLAVIDEALADLVEMRETEGARLLEDLRQRLRGCREAVDTIESRAGEVKAEYYGKVRKRIEEFTGGLEINKERLEQEVALLADRADVTEEIVRLRSHIDQMLDLLEAGGVIGKKLDFLVQEMHREINTIGAKGRSVDINRVVIGFKSELEKIREQVQNVE